MAVEDMNRRNPELFIGVVQWDVVHNSLATVFRHGGVRRYLDVFVVVKDGIHGRITDLGIRRLAPCKHAEFFECAQPILRGKALSDRSHKSFHGSFGWNWHCSWSYPGFR
ncbi:hypothetical protein V5799_027764 [Amblyomma americanum]|uniref:Uncharacterized protein n=1 Tax=Amblyomma americanum TaxID=6943 RepID=A0AAQ4DET1_AMBAM